MAVIVFALDRPVKRARTPRLAGVTTFGVHTGVQNTTVAELRELWAGVEALGFDAVSVWDHLYSSDLAGYECHEAVSVHAALACATTRVRCGCLVYCAGYRHPGILAKAATTIDHLSGGRAEIGLGAGWAQAEYDAYGIEFPPLGRRLDLLDECAGAVRSLLRRPSTTFEGAHVRLTDARNEPRPVQADLPIWIGGTGERRTARIVARHGDGWNLPFVAHGDLAAKRDALARHCDDVGRDPADVRIGVNVVVCDDEASLHAQFGPRAQAVRPGAVVGTSVGRATEALARYVAAGADTVNVALRAPWDAGALERAAAAVAALR
jgi:alkanesulfonate monooxygenase SsuD/methylene tetrahydromethanopterin reductase-like flavin-dependent oxidoreductase (luciferase family)